MEKTYYGLPLYPEGWYVVRFSDELRPGDVHGLTFCGQEVVLFRTGSGRVGLIDAYCGHMGAHFAHGGTVEGETIRCPFHGFCFNTSGDCTRTGYGTPPSPRVTIPHIPVREMHGIILAYHHPTGAEPTWEVPDIDTEGWSPMRHITWTLRSHPQETAENAVDIGHFAEVHGYQEIREIEPFTYEGPAMFARYGGVRPAGLLKHMSRPIEFEFHINKYGFGYSRVETQTHNYGITTRHFVFSQPIDGERIHLRIAVSMKDPERLGRINPALALMPRGLAKRIVLNATFRGYQNDVRQDFKIWENKRYVHPPALSKGDGPVMQFRRWASQFYAQDVVPA